MGKKKVAVQTAEEAIKSSETVDAAVAKAGLSAVASAKAGVKATESSNKLDKGRAYINASYNNTLVSVTDERGNVKAWSSAGALGFAGPKKATPFAASKVIAALAEKLRKSGPMNLEVFVNGVGGGRDSAIRSLNNQGFNILTIKDVTGIPHNGPRAKKVRRV